MRLKWRAVVAGDEDPHYFEIALARAHFGGWTSRGNPIYPLDIVVALERKYRIHRVEIGVRRTKIPSRIHIKIGSLSREPSRRVCHASIDYIRARQARYYTGAVRNLELQPNVDQPEVYTVRFDNEATDYSDDAPNVGEYLWLIVDEPPRDNPDNFRNQIHLTQLSVYGSELNCLRYQESDRNRDKFRGGETQTHQSFSCSSDEEEYRYDKSKRSSSQSSSSMEFPSRRSSSMDVQRKLFRIEYVYDSFPETSTLYSSPDRECNSPTPNMTTSNGHDILVRVKGLLCEKFAEHLRAGREITSELCQRALRQIEAVEMEISEVAAALSAAKLRGDTKTIAECHIKSRRLLKDCFHVVHLELLVGRRRVENLLSTQLQ